MKTEEGNKLIAEFLGWVYHTKNHNWLHSRIAYATWADNSKVGHKGLYFNESWDWLMPVVEKIRDSYEGEELHQKSCELYDDVQAMVRELNIQWVWQKVINFITWFNQTSTNNSEVHKEEQK